MTQPIQGNIEVIHGRHRGGLSASGRTLAVHPPQCDRATATARLLSGRVD